MAQLEAQHTQQRGSTRHSHTISLLLENVRSGYNVGATFRTADAFGVERVLLCGYTPLPPHREIQKTSLGAVNTVSWEAHPDAVDVIKRAKSDGYSCIAVEQVENGQWLGQEMSQKHEQKLLFIFGNEVKGVSDEVLAEVDYCIEIPQYGAKHSLNLSVSVGVVLWEYVRRT